MYAKVFSQIYDGTLCTKGPWEALVTFQQMLVLADQEGNVDMTAEAIARRTTIPLNIIKTGIEVLGSPDPESRTPDEEGRRLVLLSDNRHWGWRIVNYKHYRELKREQDRRDYHRDYWHRRKDALNKTQQAQPNQPIAEAEAKAEAKRKAPTELPASSQSSDPVPDFDGNNLEDFKARAVAKMAAGWELPAEWGLDAETLGFPRSRVITESEKFRIYWTKGKGMGKRKSIRGWRQAWSNWLGKAAERM